MTSANLEVRTVSRYRTKRRIRDLQHDEYCADHDTLEATSKNGVRNDWQCLVDYHVRQKEEAVLPDGLHSVSVRCEIRRRGQEGTRKIVRRELTVFR